VPAEAWAVTASAVISPLKSESAVTTLDDFAAAIVVTLVVALAVTDCAETIDPSAGYWKTPPATGAWFGGEATAGVDAAFAFGSETLIPHAVAAPVGACAGPDAPADPKASSATGRSSARRRRNPPRILPVPEAGETRIG